MSGQFAHYFSQVGRGCGWQLQFTLLVCGPASALGGTDFLPIGRLRPQRYWSIFSPSAVIWLSIHRLHHHKTDVPGEDPHSPRDGRWWSHILWIVCQDPKIREPKLMLKY